jgi:hypothetical protein
MEYINVHLFENLKQAQAAIEIINNGEGIPASPDSVTTTYTEPKENNGQIYIIADDITEKYIDYPIEIKIIYPEI